MCIKIFKTAARSTMMLIWGWGGDPPRTTMVLLAPQRDMRLKGSGIRKCLPGHTVNIKFIICSCKQTGEGSLQTTPPVQANLKRQGLGETLEYKSALISSLNPHIMRQRNGLLALRSFAQSLLFHRASPGRVPWKGIEKKRVLPRTVSKSRGHN